MGHPVKPASVHDGSAHGRAVPVHVLGGGMRHDVRAPLQRPAVDGRGKGVVHDQGYAVRVRGSGKLLNVQYGQRGVGDGFAKDGLGVGAERCVQLFPPYSPARQRYM